MTKNEAIAILEVSKHMATSGRMYNQAIDMAIEALSEPKTIIGIDIPYGSDKGLATLFKGKDDKLILKEVKEIMSVVRCKDCRHRYEEGDCTHYYWCRLNDRPIDDTDFCAWGERKGGDDE